MPYGLFDYEDAMEPMGLTPAFNPSNPYGYSTTNPAPRGSFDPDGYSKIPAPTMPNKGLFTRAIPENAPQQTTMALGEEGNPTQSGNPYTDGLAGESGIPQQMMTQAIPENPPSQSGIPSTAQKHVYWGMENSPPQQTSTLAIPESSPMPPPTCNPMTTRPAFGTSECAPTPINPPTTVCIRAPCEQTENNPTTMAIPEGGVPPTPPSGQCPVGYTSNDAGVNIGAPVEGGAFNYAGNSNPYGLTAGQQIIGSPTGKPFNVNQAGNTWTQIGSSGGGGGGGGGLPKWGASQMAEILGTQMPSNKGTGYVGNGTSWVFSEPNNRGEVIGSNVGGVFSPIYPSR